MHNHPHPLIITRDDLRRNFDVSVVMPFYKKMREFRRVFPLNRKYFERNGIEVVLVLDTPEEQEELLDYITDFPFVNWRVIVNDKPHPWRNPTKPLNVGIRFASKRYVMVCSPESEMVTDVIYLLRKTFTDYPDTPHYAIGQVCYADDEAVTEENFHSMQHIPFGSVMVERKYLEQIHGYDETFTEWGGDDNNLRARLDMIGVGELFVDGAMMAHRDIGNHEGKVRRSKPFEKTPNDAMRHFFFPDTAVAGDEHWGHDFDRIIYDWKTMRPAQAQLQAYLENFVKSEVKLDCTARPVAKLLLVQAYNESAGIDDFLHHCEQYFDGIILLDDGSSDGTYEIAKSEKLLVKAQKRRTCFNDLENRNMLLRLASFFNYEIACFMDVDERLDSRFADLEALIDDKTVNTYLSAFVHLWDSNHTYNAQYPKSLNGIGLKTRIFRNIGSSQIISDRGRLHFSPVPTQDRMRLVPILMLHLATINKQDRIKKHDFYLKEDTEHCQASYEHFLATPELREIDSITENDLMQLTKLLRPNA